MADGSLLKPPHSEEVKSMVCPIFGTINYPNFIVQTSKPIHQSPSISYMEAATASNFDRTETDRIQPNLTNYYRGRLPLKTPTIREGKPSITFKQKDKNRLIAKVKHVLIAKFSHGRPSTNAIHHFIKGIKPKGDYIISIYNYKHIFIEFDLFEDFVRTWLKKTLVVNGFPVRLFKWSDSFNPDIESCIAPVWIRLPRLPLYLYEVEALLTIANAIGTPLSIDQRNIDRSNIGYASLCVELDVSRTPMEEVWIGFEEDGSDVICEGFWQQVIVEDLPSFCSCCKHLGHLREACKRQQNYVEKKEFDLLTGQIYNIKYTDTAGAETNQNILDMAKDKRKHLDSEKKSTSLEPEFTDIAGHMDSEEISTRLEPYYTGNHYEGKAHMKEIHLEKHKSTETVAQGKEFNQDISTPKQHVLDTNEEINFSTFVDLQQDNSHALQSGQNMDFKEVNKSPDSRSSFPSVGHETEKAGDAPDVRFEFPAAFAQVRKEKPVVFVSHAATRIENGTPTTQAYQEQGIHQENLTIRIVAIEGIAEFTNHKQPELIQGKNDDAGHQPPELIQTESIDLEEVEQKQSETETTKEHFEERIVLSAVDGETVFHQPGVLDGEAGQTLDKAMEMQVLEQSVGEVEVLSSPNVVGYNPGHDASKNIMVDLADTAPDSQLVGLVDVESTAATARQIPQVHKQSWAYQVDIADREESIHANQHNDMRQKILNDFQAFPTNLNRASKLVCSLDIHPPKSLQAVISKREGPRLKDLKEQFMAFSKSIHVVLEKALSGSSSHQQIEEEPVYKAEQEVEPAPTEWVQIQNKRGRGRPKGSKNRTATPRTCETQRRTHHSTKINNDFRYY